MFEICFFTLSQPGNRILGLVELPDLNNKHPVVVMLHGFTGDHITSAFKFPRLSRRLVKRGIATIRFDFRGSGDSEGRFEDMTPLTELRDAREVLEYVRSQPFYNGSMGLVGYSLGGMIASLLAPSERDVKSVCLWSPAVLNLELFEELSKDLESRLDEDGFLDIGGLRISRRFKDDALSIDASAELAKFSGDVLIVHGTEDETVPFGPVSKYAKNHKFQLHAIEGGDHRFTKYQWVEELIEVSATFFERSLLRAQRDPLAPR